MAAHPDTEADDPGSELVDRPPLTITSEVLGETLRAWVRWIGPRRILAAAGTVLVLAGLAWWLLRSPQLPTESGLPRAERVDAAQVASTTTTVPAPTTLAAVVLVHVTGAVAQPGVYELSPGERVADAIAAAGGATGNADPDVLNLAAPVSDGDRIAVPVAGEPAGGPASGGHTHASNTGGEGAPNALVNVNDASAAELEALPGIGPATAAAIVEHRQQNGPFASVLELEEVRGIGPAKLDALRDHVTV
jgi:competence protein ComEA